MDIAQYVGLFLLKNKYCCLQGLGNLEIKRTASTHNGAELTAASYYATLNPVGSLDDAFPNFVATNEQVSIAKASNEISSFVKNSKATIAAGGKVDIPSVGAYFEKNNQLHFELDPAFSMPNQSIVMPLPTTKNNIAAEKKETENKEEHYPQYNNYNAPKAINWNLIAFWGVIIIIGGSILFWSIRYMLKEQGNTETALLIPVVEKPEVPEVIKADSTIIPDSTVAAKPINANDTPEYTFVIKEYSSLAAAQKREKQLTSYGYSVSVKEQDSSTFYVVNKIKAQAADTLKIKDSLSKILNPSGVFILH